MQNFNDEKILEKNISRERMFDGIILHIDHVTNELPNGKHAKREIAVHVDASAVLPVDGEGNVYLVRQFRAPIDQVLLEIPAGKLDSVGEDPLDCAVRELEEETGLRAEKMTPLTSLLTTPGFCTEKIGIYLAQGLSQGDTHPDEDEFLGLVRIPLDEAIAMVMRGEIRDSKTICGLMMAREVIGRQKEQA